MFQQWNGQSPKSNLRPISILILHPTAVFLLVTHCCGGQSQVVGPTKPILAIVGDDIILPCHLEPARDVVAETLEWARFDLKPSFVHVRRDGVELLVNQNPSYIGRTSVSTDKLKHGDISLKLSKVKPSDEGEYRCHIPGLGTSVVELAVGALSSPVVTIVEIDKAISRVVLQCESAGWYPEPEVFWLHGEEKLVSAGPTETVRGPDDLYTVSSRVTVETRHGNSFICRVQQQNINQTRETEIRFLEDVFMAPSSSVVRIIVFLSVCFLLFSAFFLVFWKLSQNKGPNKMHHDNETEDGTGEVELLVRGSTKRKDLDEEKLQEKEKEPNDLVNVISVLMEQEKEKEKEQNDMIQVISVLMEQKKEKEKEQNDMKHVISVLMKQKEELEISRDEHMSQLEKVKEETRKNEKKLESLKSKHKVNKGNKKSRLLEGKLELQNRKAEDEKSLKNIEEIRQKTQDAITTITEWKKKAENQIEQIKKQLETKRQRDEIQSEQLERQEETNILIHQHLDELKTDSPQSIETQSDSDITIPVQQSSSGQNTATAHSGVRQQTD